MDRAAAVAALVGGLVWVPVRWAISVTFSDPLLALSYEDWNRIGVVPIGLMLVALVIGFRRAPMPRSARVGWWMASAGLVGMLAGVIVEFWIGGGLRGDRELALTGWLVYLLPGIGLHLVGMVLLGIGLARARPSLGVTSLAIGFLHALWIPAGLAADWLLLLDQTLIGLGWAWIGIVLWRSPQVSTSAG